MSNPKLEKTPPSSAPSPAQAALAPHGEPLACDERSFWALVATMFQGAFSDNVYKLVLFLFAADLAVQQTAGASNPLAEANRLGALYQMAINVAFTLPWILAAAFAGWLGDRFSKAQVTRWTKVMEIGVMSMAAVGFALQQHFPMQALYMGVFVMFLMALQSTFFSPSKYGVLAELMPGDRLAWANGVLQGFTFISIILGTIVAPPVYGFFKEQDPDHLWFMGGGLVLLAGLGWICAMQMRLVPPANPGERVRYNPYSTISSYGPVIWHTPALRWGVVGLITFWVTAIMLQPAAVLMSKNVLGFSDAQTAAALAPIVVGMGLGCFLVGWLSRKHIELGLVPIGSAGMFIGGIIMALVTPAPTMVANLTEAELHALQLWIPLLMGMMGFFSGFIIVPLDAVILHESDPRIRGGIWATASLFAAVGWIIGTVVYAVLLSVRGNPADVFLFSGALMAAMTAVICWKFPRIPLRFLILVFFRAFFRVRARGVENIPAQGGALLAPNHQSYLDGILMAAVANRPIRFVMSQQVYNKPFIWPFARLTNSIPIEQNQSPRELLAALRAAREEIEAGGVVCIFPEGALTRIGALLPFRRGVERIMKGLDAPIIPIAIDGAYDTAFALARGEQQWRRALRLRRRAINVSIGEPLPKGTPLWQLRRAVTGQMVEAFAMRKEEADALHRLAVAQLRRRPLTRLYSDVNNPNGVPNARLLAGAWLLGRALRSQWADQEYVGLLVPPSLAAVSVNLAALLGGKVPVNLNYTSGKAINEEICRRTGIKTVITSRAFVEKARLELWDGPDVVYLEDLREQFGGGAKLMGLLAGLLLPLGLLERALGRQRPAGPDDLVALLFSSGSTGVPKGVMLTNWNVLSNCLAACQVVGPDPESKFAGILPFFHSFGFMSTLWLPLINGFGCAYYPNPLDGRAIGDLVEKHQLTHLFATPTFLAGYLRRVEPGQFGSIRYILTGAEKLRSSLREAFADRFGIEPREGFGCTECSPAVAINGSDYRAPGLYQSSNKRGTIGQALPGVQTRIRSIETGELLAPGEPGMLEVRGPNVMAGYFQMEEKTAEVLRDGWYTTGDIATMDEEGYVTITDRLARFSKIGGEMVPHGKVEDALQSASGEEAQAFAVTGVPDEKKGEKLVVFFTCPEARARAAREHLETPEAGFPALFIPRWGDFHAIEDLPLLGSGKLDLQKLKALAKEHGGAAAESPAS